MNFSEMLSRVFTLVVEASIAATILAVFVFAMERVLHKRLSPAWRFAIYLPVLLRLLLPIVPQSPTSLLNLRSWIDGTGEKRHSYPLTMASGRAAAPIVGEVNAEPVQLTSLTPMRAGAEPALGISPVRFFAMVWLAVSAILLLRLGVGAFRLNRRLRRAQTASPEVIDLLENLRLESGTRWKPRVIETSLVQTPCLFGLVRPRLLLPTRFATRLTTIELSHVMLHELAHLKRGDLAINALMAIAQAVHWFNPFVWLLFRRMRLLRELACDRMVLEMRRADAAETKAYGETLLKLITGFSSRAASSSTIGILENERSAKTRLRQIAAFVPGRKAVSLTGLLLISMLVVTGLSKAQTPRIQTPATSVEVAPSIAANSPQEIKAKRHAANIETLEREYVRAKKEVDEAQETMDRLMKELRIEMPSKGEYEAGLANGTILSAESNAADLLQRIQKAKEQLSHVTVLLDELKALPRKELRKALPTSLQPADEALNRLLSDYSSAEQKYAQLSGSFSDGHPDVASARDVLATINRQIEERIDGILMGLDVRKKSSGALIESLQMESDRARAMEADRREKYMPFFRAKRSLENAQRHLDAIFMRLLAEKVDATAPAPNLPSQALE